MKQCIERGCVQSAVFIVVDTNDTAPEVAACGTHAVEFAEPGFRVTPMAIPFVPEPVVEPEDSDG